LKNLKYKDLLDKKDISHFISYEEGTLDIGDIAISYETCFKKAKEVNLIFEDYIIHMLIHSCLHLLGFDHKKYSEFKLMNDIEIKSLNECGINNPYKKYLKI
jgi:probable rRNA maturation factor